LEKANEVLDRQRAKRKRVARMKKFIVTTVLSFMVLTITIMSFLFYEVLSLKKQLDELSQQVYVSTNVEDTDEFIDDSVLDDVYTIDDIDNMAVEGDIPKVYLTFDDGPSENTDRILDILDDYNVKATFFVIGQDPVEYGDTYKRIVDEGHTIGMHSYSHNYSKIYASEEAFIEDYNQIHDLKLQ
jgi:peptidoglycan/xylan/chitin deacetylase (PgdA/CDA1 family)